MTSPNRSRVLVLAVFLVMLGLTLVAPIVPLYAREFGVGRTAAGALVSVFAVSRLVFDLFGGPSVDRLGARRMMTWSGGVIAVSSVTAATAPTYSVLLLSRFVEGAGSAAFATAAMQYLLVTTPVEERGRAMARYQMGLLGGIAVGPVIGGYAASLGDFRTPFWLYAGIGVVVAIVAVRYVGDVAMERKSLGELYRLAGKLLLDPRYLALLFVTFSLFVMRGGARITVLPLFAGEELMLDVGLIGWLFSAGALANLVSLNPVGKLVDRIGRKPILVVGLLLDAIGVAAFALGAGFWSLLVVSVGLGLVNPLAAVPPPTLAGDLAPPGATGASVGLYRAAGDIGLILGPLGLAALVEGGNFALGFLASALLLLLAAAAATAIREAPRRREAPVGVTGP